MRLVGVEASGHGLDTAKHAATLTKGSPGVLHGSYSYLLQDDEGQVIDPHSISAGCATLPWFICCTLASPSFIFPATAPSVGNWQLLSWDQPYNIDVESTQVGHRSRSGSGQPRSVASVMARCLLHQAVDIVKP